MENGQRKLNHKVKSGAVLVAAGKSSRMKAFKPLLPLSGTTIIGRIIKTLKSKEVSPIVVVIGKQAGQLQEYLAGIDETGDIVCLYNEKYENTDMFYSACMGLEFIQERAEQIFFLPADVPLFSQQSLKIMTKEMDLGNCDMILPQRCGKQGHPILIKSKIIPTLLSYNGEQGLKGAIEEYDGKKETMELPDIGITLDADRRSDYELMKLLTDETVPENIRKHSALVAQLAVNLGKKLNNRGYCLDLHQIELAALLHDISRTQPNHACVGGKLLEDIGHPRLAEIVRRHMQLLPEQEGQISEITLVYLADKFSRGDQPVTLEQRFERKRKSFHDQPQSLEALEKKYQSSLRVKRLFESAVGFRIDPYELMKD
jgi:CTP:molybdopterin cytidylyltransferase MocA